MDEELTDAEREELRKLSTLQRVAWQILFKWKWLILGVFAFLSIAFSLYIVWHYSKSGHRFEAITRLSYMPRKVARVENLSDKQLFSILERPSLKRRVGTKLSLTHSERECLGIDLTITQERRPTNIFTIKANAGSQLAAISKANMYAKVLIDEYSDYRTRDLTALRESTIVRRDRLRNQIAELDSEESILKGKSGVASPVETLTTLNALLSDERRDLSLLKVQMLNEEVKMKRLDESVGELGPAILKCAAYIREKSAKLAALDKDIAALRELYTDINPKVIGKLDDRQKLLQEYTEYLAQNGIKSVTLEAIEQIEKSASELSETKLRINVLAESRRSLEQEIKDNERRSGELTSIIPSLERINGQRMDLERTMRTLEDQIGEIDYLQMAMAGDLRQIERAGGARDNNPLRKKNFILAVAAAFACALALCFWILTLELLFGKISGAKELTADGEINLLGSLPVPGTMSATEEKDILGVVALKFCNCEVPKNVVFVCRLPGAPEQTAFNEAAEWSLTMAGKRTFTLEIVKSSLFEPPENAQPMIGTFCHGSYGWFPVENRYMLVSSEREMLQADLDALKKDYDIIFIKLPEGMRRGGSFFSQVLEVCDSVLLVAGANATPRSWVAYARRNISAAEKPIMGLITGVSAKVAGKEMENSNG